MKSPCSLRSLAEQVIDQPLGGLLIDEGRLQLDKSQFPCCDGSGAILDAEKNTARQCDLSWRFYQVKKLLDQYYSMWGSEHPLLPQDLRKKPQVKILASKLETLRKPNQPRTHIVQKVVAPGPSSLWPMALMSAWHFAMPVHFVCFGKTPSHAYLPKEEVWGKDRQGLMLFLGNVKGLDDGAVADDFQTLVSYAYDHGAFLFVELNRGPEDKSVGGGFFSRKLQALRSRPLAEVLPAHCLSRLESMCAPQEFYRHFFMK